MCFALCEKVKIGLLGLHLHWWIVSYLCPLPLERYLWNAIPAAQWFALQPYRCERNHFILVTSRGMSGWSSCCLLGWRDDEPCSGGVLCDLHPVSFRLWLCFCPYLCLEALQAVWAVPGDSARGQCRDPQGSWCPGVQNSGAALWLWVKQVLILFKSKMLWMQWRKKEIIPQKILFIHCWLAWKGNGLKTCV